ncbi:MAG: DNA primase [Alistipes sp.]|nr:DNA primase [Alistipes sp.]
MIDNSTIDRIYAAADIVEVIGDYITLKRQGVNYQACCPFHNEKTPSFVVSPSKGIFKCFGCGKAGNAVTFVREHEGVSFAEALKIVGKKYGIEVQEREQSEEDIRRNNDRESMFALNAWASEYFARYLSGSDEGRTVGLSYFAQKRGFTDATIRKFGLGFCSADGEAMTMAALSAGYKKEFLLSTGLTLQREGDGKLRDRFRDRVMFPVHNISGRVVAFGGRTLRTDKSVAKYQNSPESDIYSKKRELYGLYFAKKAIQQQDFAIMVEGYTDVISMHQAGVENVVASSGTSLTTEQIQLLRRFTRNITVIYDGDSAGIHASLRGIDMILKEGMNVRVVLLPPEHDPDSFARAHSATELQTYIKDNEQDFISFKAKLMLESVGSDPIKRSEVIRDMVQSIVQVPDSIKRAIYIQECARIMSIDEQTLVTEVARQRVTSSGDKEVSDFIRRQQAEARREQVVSEVERYTQPITAGSSIKSLETELIKYLLLSGHKNYQIREGKKVVNVNVATEIIDNVDQDGITFQDDDVQELYNTYRKHWLEKGEGKEIDTLLFTQHANPNVCEKASDIIASDSNYVPSEIWRKKDVHIESDEELLAMGVHKALMLYRSKIIDNLIAEQNALLANEELSEEEHNECIKEITKLNRIKNALSRESNRVVI